MITLFLCAWSRAQLLLSILLLAQVISHTSHKVNKVCIWFLQFLSTCHSSETDFWYVRFLMDQSVTSDTIFATGCGGDINSVKLVLKTLNPKINQEQEKRHSHESECLEMLLKYCNWDVNTGSIQQVSYAPQNKTWTVLQLFCKVSFHYGGACCQISCLLRNQIRCLKIYI